MRDIKYVLESWGAWVVNSSDSSIAKSLSGLIPHKIKSRKRCSNDDGICISNCMTSLHEKNPEAYDLLFDYYVLGKTFMSLAFERQCSDTHIGKKLQNAEGIFEGYLMALDVSLSSFPI